MSRGVEISIDYYSDSHPHWYWMAAIEDSVNGFDAMSGWRVTRKRAERAARKAARKLLKPKRREKYHYTLTHDDLYPQPLTKGMVRGKGTPPTNPPPGASSVGDGGGTEMWVTPRGGFVTPVRSENIRCPIVYHDSRCLDRQGHDGECVFS